MKASGRVMELTSQRPESVEAEPADLAAIARSALAQLDRRSAHLPQVLNEDPQWRMVLNLLIARESGFSLCVSDLCVCSAVPRTTALRHIASLERSKVIIRSRHACDARSSLLTLHDFAYRQATNYLRSIIQ